MILSIDPGLHAIGASLWGTETSNDLIWAGLIKNKIDAHPQNPTYHSVLWRGMVDAVDERLYSMFGPPTAGKHKWPDRMVIELPQVYIASRSKGDPNDLIALAGVVGAFAHWFAGMTTTCSPHSWKGTVPKAIMNARILKHLSPEEQSKIEKAPKSLLHNTLDSVGIGLAHLNRL